MSPVKTRLVRSGKEKADPNLAELAKLVRLGISVHFELNPSSAIKRTEKERKDKLDELRSYIFEFSHLPYLIRTGSIDTLFDLFVLATVKKKTRLSVDELRHFIGSNEIMTPTIVLCRDEFLVFFSELETAAYSGAARTLRCILETALDACEFQCEDGRPTWKMLYEQFRAVTKMPKKDQAQEYRTLLTRYNATAAFRERHRIHERNKRIAPSFVETVNRVNARQIFHESPQLDKELKKAYEVLSDYVHPSLTKLENLGRLLSLEGIKHKTDEIKLDFDPTAFDDICELGIKTLDAVQFLYVMSISNFLGYENVGDFLNKAALHKTGISPRLSSKASSLLDLPFSSRLRRRMSKKRATIRQTGTPKRP